MTPFPAVYLDECVDWRLGEHLTERGFVVYTTLTEATAGLRHQGWLARGNRLAGFSEADVRRALGR